MHMHEAVARFFAEMKSAWLDQALVRSHLAGIQQAYNIQSPIHRVTFVGDEEGRSSLFFAFCHGDRDAIKRLVDHESHLMGPRDTMVSFLETDLETAILEWAFWIQFCERNIDLQKIYLSGSYPRSATDYFPGGSLVNQIDKPSDERVLHQYEQRLCFLQETGPVLRVKPSGEVQICPLCLNSFQEGQRVSPSP